MEPKAEGKNLTEPLSRTEWLMQLCAVLGLIYIALAALT